MLVESVKFHASCLTDRASAATDSADRQRCATEVPTPECYRIQERPAVCCQLQALVGRRRALVRRYLQGLGEG